MCPDAGGSKSSRIPSDTSARLRRSTSTMASLSSSTSRACVSRDAAAVSWRAAASRSRAARSRTRSRIASAARPLQCSVSEPGRRAGRRARGCRRPARAGVLRACAPRRSRRTSHPLLPGSASAANVWTAVRARVIWKTWLVTWPPEPRNPCSCRLCDARDHRRVGRGVDRGAAVDVDVVVVVVLDARLRVGVDDHGGLLDRRRVGLTVQERHQVAVLLERQHVDAGREAADLGCRGARGHHVGDVEAAVARGDRDGLHAALGVADDEDRLVRRRCPPGHRLEDPLLVVVGSPGDQVEVGAQVADVVVGGPGHRGEVVRAGQVDDVHDLAVGVGDGLDLDGAVGRRVGALGQRGDLGEVVEEVLDAGRLLARRVVGGSTTGRPPDRGRPAPPRRRWS